MNELERAIEYHGGAPGIHTHLVTCLSFLRQELMGSFSDQIQSGNVGSVGEVSSTSY